MPIEDWIARESASILPTYRRFPVMFVRGSGTSLWDAAGREYLDFVSGIGVVGLGHAHPRVTRAVTRQMERLTHTSNLFYTEPQIHLAERLSQISLRGRCFFANSGAEANEAAIKLARGWGRRRRNGAYKVITATDSFHGRTLATLAATGQPDKHAPFQPMPDGFVHVPFNDVGALERAIDDETAAVLLELIQGEAGVQEASSEYAAAARRLTTEAGALLIVDEVLTGLGRTGEFFAYQGYGIEPDAITLAKSLANGLPIGALVTGHHAGEALGPGEHATTFGGGPVVTAAALATLIAIDQEGLVTKAASAGEFLRSELESLVAKFPLFTEVRGRGLMLAVQFSEPLALKVAVSCLHKGVLVNNVRPDAIRLLPPLVVGKPEIERLVEVLAHAVKEVWAARESQGQRSADVG